MFLAAVNRCQQLLHLRFIGSVTVADLESRAGEMENLLGELSPGFTLLTDLSQLEAMETACEHSVGQLMELCRKHGVGRIVRVIPEPSRDIGFGILSVFHYGPETRATTCNSLTEAARYLGN